MVDSTTSSDEDLIEFSRTKLLAVGDSLKPLLPLHVSCDAVVCRLATDCVGYRSRCSFQVVWTEQNDTMQYAIRRHQNPVVIHTFPIANLRIQCAMTALRHQLNKQQQADRFSELRHHLTSVSFATSWKDATIDEEDDDDTDCLVTLHYDEIIANPERWIAQARHLCSAIRCTQVSGQARKLCHRASREADLDTDSKIPAVIRDILWLYKTNDSIDWAVSLTRPTDVENFRIVRYEKPEHAFSHPNARAMCRALEWMLSRVEAIRRACHDDTSCSESLKAPPQSLRLLELYCGCGAHTMSLLQSNLLTDIVAVELDERLVKACRRNLTLNTSSPVTDPTTTTLDIISMDAGLWAKRSLGLSTQKFDILLVDPPKQGLDEQVCRMSTMGSFQHVLYISCGHEALVRDLDRLSTDYEVVDCVLLDLFPQTQAVETLVHLRRRQAT